MEVILINDGSTDGTLEVIKKYKERYNDVVRYISISNSGVGVARNLGIQEAIGEYILFIDGDDMLFDSILPQWMEYIYRNTLDIAFTGYEDRDWDDKGKLGENKNYLEGIYTGEEILIKKLKKQIWICTGNAIYRTQILKRNNLKYSVSYRYGEDAEFIGKCLLNSLRVSSLNKQGLIIMVRRTSAMLTVSFEKYKDAIHAFENLQNYAFNFSISSALRNAFAFDYLNLYLGIVKILFKNTKRYDKKLLINLSDIEYPCWSIPVKVKKRVEIMLYRKFPFLYFRFVHIYYFLKQNRWKHIK